MAGLSDSVVGVEGLGGSGRITIVALTASAWTALPTTALTDRNAILIQNQSDNGNVVLLNYSASAASEGMRLEDRATKGVSLKSSIVLYGRMVSGTGSVAVEELA
jgi:hypothetical protein